MHRTTIPARSPALAMRCALAAAILSATGVALGQDREQPGEQASRQARVDVVGWRTPGTVNRPDATPLLEWSDSLNVLWKAPMPDEANSSPVLWGYRLFTTAEKTLLLCLDADTGEILWRRDHAYTELAAPDADENAPTPEELAELQREVTSLRPEAIRTRRMLRRAGDNAERQAELQAQLTELDQRIARIEQRLESHADLTMPRTQYSNGYASMTPVTDGEHVWAAFGNGVVACYDMDGRRKWIRLIARPTHDWGTSNSPILAGGRLIIGMNQRLVAVDPLTGEPVWEHRFSRNSFGSPMTFEVDGVELIATANGEVLHPEDGRVIAADLPYLEYSTPVIEDGVMYRVDANRAWAHRLPESLETPEFTTLWQTPVHNDRYYASPLLHDGVLYVITRHAVITALDARTGERLYEQASDFPGTLSGNRIYTSIVAAGDRLFAGSITGRTLVFEPGPTFQPVAINRLADMRSTPLFVGERMYVRTYQHLYCIGPAR